MQRIPLVRQLTAVVLAIAFTLSIAPAAFAAGGQTGSINGTVLDVKTQAPLNNVAVTAASPSGSYHTTTDATGKFSIAGILVDTYAVSLKINGYAPVSLSGVTIQGDSNVALGTVTMQKSLTEIAHVTSRSASSAFQPGQTTDQYSINSARKDQALGKKDNVSETNLILSVPGTQTNAAGALAIRGSQRTQLSYQFDGINYTEPLGNQFENNLFLNGVGSLQVVPGAGDATQGNAGSGVINIIPKRGTSPAFGHLDVEANSFPRFNQYALEYGWASPDGRWSDYISYVDQSSGRQYGWRGQDAAEFGLYYATSAFKASDLVNNLVYKFGKNNNQSLQLLTQNRYSKFYANYGGFSNIFYPDNSPDTYAALGLAAPGSPKTASKPTPAIFQQILAFYPGQQYITQPLGGPTPTQTQPLGAIKLEYRNSVSASTYYVARIYRTVANAYFENGTTAFASTNSAQNVQGGTRTGVSGEWTKQVNDKHLITAVANYELEKPVFLIDSVVRGYRAISGSSGVGALQWQDFVNPVAGVCPVGTPAGSTSNPCYLATFFGGKTPQIPPYGINITNPEQNYGAAIRDQFQVNTRLKLDFGVRYDGANYHLPAAGPYQVPVAPTAESNTPRVWEPRFAAAYQMGRNDAVRFSYGRSVQFAAPTVIFTPINQDNFAAYRGIPVPANEANLCGAKQTSSCNNDYAQLLYWQQNNAFDYPELTPLLPATFNNFDFSFAHLFKNGWGIKVTPFYTQGYNVTVITSDIIGTNPATNAPIFGPGTPQSKGVEKTTGVEMYFTTPDRPEGLSAFVSATYVNKITNVPPTNGFALEDFYPSIPSASLAAGNLYRVGYLTPLYVRSGLTYKHGGWKINPVVGYDKGYPYGNGLMTPVFVRGVATNVPNTNVTGAFGSTSTSQYVDPANPGSLYNPNIAAGRGTPEGAAAGSVLTHPRLNLDLTIEYTPNRPKGTFGLAVFNMFNQIYSEPVINTRYQPVSPGVAGPQSGQTANQVNFPQYGQRNYFPDQFGFDPYRLIPTNTPRTLRLYYQLPF